jgi:KDO2-lipid IV(A) lauroyltransferase
MYKIGLFLLKAFFSLPFFILDLISILSYFLLKYVFKYRLKLMKRYLHNAFPEKSEKEIQTIINKFYLHFSDLVMESLKVMSFSNKNYNKHVHFTNDDYLNQYFEQNKNVIIIAGHFANWEWVSLLATYTKYDLLAVYKPLKTKFWDYLIKTTRERHGSHTVPMRNTYRKLAELNESKTLWALGLVSDQCPPKEKAIWAKFMGQDTAYFPGPEKIARDENAVIVYLSVYKTKRHFYEATFRLVTETPRDLPEGMIIQKFSSLLEQDVKLQPELYIWSHKRWKYAKE